ncbi:argininosuccinate lyase [Candidatus Roizmanbacteria bacterium]|nr:argininosuccinate lyase [Candidatus Roizmanbacteria bacterium]
MKKLWEKGIKLNEVVETYTSGENVGLDNELVFYDAVGSIAHAYMLWKIGILTEKEFKVLQKGLNEVINLQKFGQFEVSYGDEDVHTKIEYVLTTKMGEAGKKLHTGRSRNDQIQVDLRLFAKDGVYSIAEGMFKFIEKCLKFAKKYEFLPMPGYTHMQKAMPSSVGTWAGSFAESGLDDLVLLKTAYHINDQSPLGSGAAYGVPLPIDRALTSKLLGFAKVQNNVLYAQVSRPKSHLALMQALCQIMLTLSRFAEDVLLFTTAEFNFFTLPAELCTGSSIMPQKKNVDVMEILRARAQIVLNNTNAVAVISSGLPSGYNADFQ